MITLYSSGFSPFSRKIQMVLEFKNLEFELVEVENETSVKNFEQINQRKEVPVLVDDGLTVVNSADIVAYLDHQYPSSPVLPESPAARVLARKWERLSDTLLDAITVDLIIWNWADIGPRPKGLLEAGKEDLEKIYQQLDLDLRNKSFVCGELSIADIALFPHLAAVKLLGIPFDKVRHSNLYGWYKTMREQPICQADLIKLKAWFSTINERPLERYKIAWRGDRLEWLLAKGFHQWFYTQIEQDKVIWPL